MDAPSCIFSKDEPGTKHCFMDSFWCVFVQIREDLRANEIDIYPQKEFDEDAEDRIINEKIRVCPLVTFYLYNSITDSMVFVKNKLFMTYVHEVSFCFFCFCLTVYCNSKCCFCILKVFK